MDSAELLDLLGNANRRRILRLLAHKPCYVTEISEYLGVSPKAVIDHLGKLEEAGLVESTTNDRRRKYFSIARNFRLEVRVSPYEFGTKSAYPTRRGFDVGSCRYVQIEVGDEDEAGDEGEVGGEGEAGGEDEAGGEGEAGGEDLSGLARRLARLEQLENELSLAQRWVQGRATEVRERIGEVADGDDGRLYAAVLSALAGGPRDVRAVSRSVEAPPELVEEALRALANRGVVEHAGRGEGWRIAE